VGGDAAVSRTEEVEEIVRRETRAWDAQDVELLLSIFHADMVWVWPSDSHGHDPISWITPLGRFDATRWGNLYRDWFAKYRLVHNLRKLLRIQLSEQEDGAFAVVDIDTLWEADDGEVSHWLGRTCKMYTLVSGEWKMISQVGALTYDSD
jgi:hypothetical protein